MVRIVELVHLNKVVFRTLELGVYLLSFHFNYHPDPAKINLVWDIENFLAFGKTKC